ncbi:hypothetical protein KLP28_12905 [Nocardioidaceae bacterium]|nr:hypothetical protein KLP28_12905 [Nocardioidaceae bacterium]
MVPFRKKDRPSDAGSSSEADLARLEELARTDEAFGQGLDGYNILLGDPSEHGEWADCPPRIGRSFAADGTEHEFSLLDNGAVVLYTPLSDTPYVVVGADMREFFALLLESNGSGVGALGYDLDEGVEELTEPEDELEPDELLVIELLRAEFGVTPWTDHRARLAELQSLLPGTSA